MKYVGSGQSAFKDSSPGLAANPPEPSSATFSQWMNGLLLPILAGMAHIPLFAAPVTQPTGLTLYSHEGDVEYLAVPYDQWSRHTQGPHHGEDAPGLYQWDASSQVWAPMPGVVSEAGGQGAAQAGGAFASSPAAMGNTALSGRLPMEAKREITLQPGLNLLSHPWSGWTGRQGAHWLVNSSNRELRARWKIPFEPWWPESAGDEASLKVTGFNGVQRQIDLSYTPNGWAGLPVDIWVRSCHDSDSATPRPFASVAPRVSPGVLQIKVPEEFASGGSWVVWAAVADPDGRRTSSRISASIAKLVQSDADFSQLQVSMDLSSADPVGPVAEGEIKPDARPGQADGQNGEQLVTDFQVHSAGEKALMRQNAIASRLKQKGFKHVKHDANAR